MEAYIYSELPEEVKRVRRLGDSVLGTLIVSDEHWEDAAVAVHVKGDDRVDPEAERDQATTEATGRGWGGHGEGKYGEGVEVFFPAVVEKGW